MDICTIVDDEGLLVGMVTRSDLFRVVEVAATLANEPARHVTISDIMISTPIVISKNDSLMTAVDTMREHGFKLLPVVESDNQRKITGYIRVEKIMDVVIKQLAK